MQMIAYHGTDMKCAKNIEKNGFIFKKNEKHWLGNGVYFYQDYHLAKWWASNPSSVFGSRINRPATIKILIDVDNDNLMDLRKINDYSQLVKIYLHEFLPLVVNRKINISNPKDRKLIRCALFDYIHEQYNIQMVIGNFDLPKQKYLPKEYLAIKNKLDLSYTETQICIFDTTVIKKIAVQEEVKKK